MNKQRLTDIFIAAFLAALLSWTPFLLKGALPQSMITFTSGTVISSSNMNANFSRLFTPLNGQIDDANIRDGAVISADLSPTLLFQTADVTGTFRAVSAGITNTFRGQNGDVTNTFRAAVCDITDSFSVPTADITGTLRAQTAAITGTATISSNLTATAASSFLSTVNLNVIQDASDTEVIVNDGLSVSGTTRLIKTGAGEQRIDLWDTTSASGTQRGGLAVGTDAFRIQRLTDAGGFTSNLAVFDFSSLSLTLPADVIVDTTTLVVDAATNRVGVGDASPEETFSVDGATSLDGGVVHKRVGTAISYTALVSDFLVGATANNITITLPAVASAGSGRVLHFKDESGTAGAGASAITIDASGAELIDGALTRQITTAYGDVSLYCTGTAWMTY